jgi:hypothetical protein
MKNPIRFSITLAGAVLCALPNLAMAQSGPLESQFAGLAAPIEGTWTLSIHRVATGIDFTALQSFTAGGVVVATGSLDKQPLPGISPLIGVWKTADGNSYFATLCFFVFDNTGKPLFMIKTNETFHLSDDDTIRSGNGTAFQCNVDGSGCMVQPQLAITFSGTRLTAQGA